MRTCCACSHVHGEFAFWNSPAVWLTTRRIPKCATGTCRKAEKWIWLTLTTKDVSMRRGSLEISISTWSNSVWEWDPCVFSYNSMPLHGGQIGRTFEKLSCIWLSLLVKCTLTFYSLPSAFSDSFLFLTFMHKATLQLHFMLSKSIQNVEVLLLFILNSNMQNRLHSFQLTQASHYYWAWGSSMSRLIHTSPDKQTHETYTQSQGLQRPHDTYLHSIDTAYIRTRSLLNW